MAPILTGAPAPDEPLDAHADAPPAGPADTVPLVQAAPALPPAAVAPPRAPVLTPPVPMDLPPPPHPLPYRMVVDAPGVAATARLQAVEARVRLRLVVRADGAVGRTDVAVSSGRLELDTAAADAARRWRFIPARRDGEPIESIALIWVAFVVGP